MARRRREVSPDAAGQAGTPPMSETGEPQATLTVRGSADAIKKQMGVSTETKPELEKKNGNGSDGEKEKFVESLRNPRYVVRIKRQAPRPLAGHCWDEECPITYTKIQDQTRDEWGGGSYRAVVVDPESNKTVTADTFEIPGNPITQEPDMTEEERKKLFMEGSPKSASDLTEEGLNRRAVLSAKLLEVEQIESQLEDARRRRDSSGKPQAQDNSKVEELDRRLSEAKHQAELEARDRKHAEELRELKASIAQIAQPKKAEGDNMMMMLLEQMREDRKQAQTQFTAILTQMKDDKLNAVLDEVKSIRNKPSTPANSLLDQAEAILKLKKVFGWGGDDEDEEEDDDRPWWERAIDKLGGKFGDKFLDKLMEKFNGMEEKGEQVTREQFIKDMSEEAQRMADQAVERARRQGLPAPTTTNPPLPAPPPPPRPAVTVPTPQATSLPPPPPPELVQQQTVPTPAPSPVPETPPKLTIEQEIVLRVGGVLEIIEREIELRPHEYHWNYEGAFCSLPESILEAVCAAPDPVTMLDAFAIQHINPENLAEMKAKIAGNPKILAWVKTGHDELKLWHFEKQKDPSYDPFADEEEGGEE